MSANLKEKRGINKRGQARAYNQMIDRINRTTVKKLDRLIQQDACPFQSELMRGMPIGMFHCPLCGDMVVAGFEHPRRKNFCE